MGDRWEMRCMFLFISQDTLRRGRMVAKEDTLQVLSPPRVEVDL